jgi:hypothetical protein
MREKSKKYYLSPPMHSYQDRLLTFTLLFVGFKKKRILQQLFLFQPDLQIHSMYACSVGLNPIIYFTHAIQTPKYMVYLDLTGWISLGFPAETVASTDTMDSPKTISKYIWRNLLETAADSVYVQGVTPASQCKKRWSCILKSSRWHHPDGIGCRP